jgi:hypothetical protein
MLGGFSKLLGNRNYENLGKLPVQLLSQIWSNALSLYAASRFDSPLIEELLLVILPPQTNSQNHQNSYSHRTHKGY